MADLEFHPFQDGFSINSGSTQNYPGRLADQNLHVKDSDNAQVTGRKFNILSLEYYQQFFDVETDQVLLRILNSFLPTNNNFILDFVHPMPDLWGPFWISVTLVFSIAIFGNLAQYIANNGGTGEYGSDFRLVTSSATLIFVYAVLVPVLLSTILWQRKSELQYTLSDLLCAYGYSLSIFVPVSILWTLDINWFRWTLIFTAVILSGTVLVKSLWPAFKSDPNKLIAYGSVFSVLLLHFLLALTFKVYFFDAAHLHSAQQARKIALDTIHGLDNHSNSQILITGRVENSFSSAKPALVETVHANDQVKVSVRYKSSDSNVNDGKPGKHNRVTLAPVSVAYKNPT